MVDAIRSTDGVPETRMRILDGTARVAVEHGLRAMTVEQVLRAASVSRRTFYLYFHNKEDAFLALYERVVGDLVEAVRGAVEDTADPTQKLFAGIDAYLDFQLAGGALVSLLQAEAANPASILSPLRERVVDELVAMTDDEVRRSLAAGLDPWLYRTLFLGLEALVIRARGKGTFDRAARKRIGRVLKHLFLQMLQSAGDMPQARDV